jgi:hypothetical protein
MKKMQVAKRRKSTMAVSFALFFLMAVAGVLSYGGTSILAQGCSMCNTVASAQSENAARALNHGILFLLIPPVTIMSAILVLAFRHRNSPADM